MSALPAQLTLFDYSALDSETRIVVQQRTTEIKGLMRRAAQDIIEIGHKLIEVKARLGHGHFGGWLRAEFEWHQNTATNFMRVAEKFTNFVNVDQIAPSALYLLAAPSTPDSAREEALDRAAAGEPISFTAARELVDAHKAPPPVASVISPSQAEVIPFEPDYDDGLADEPLDPFEQQVATRYAPPEPSRESHQLINASTSNDWRWLVLGAARRHPAICSSRPNGTAGLRKADGVLAS